MQYEKVIAIRKVGDIGIASDGRFFILIICNDTKTYQVKFNLTTTKGNQNELITHYIGTKMGAPVLIGKLITFSKRVLDSIIEVMKDRGIPADPNFFIGTELFGIEWHDGAKTAKTEEEVKTFYTMCKNRASFYAIYSFDQYLRNYDRQHFNHLMVKLEEDKKPTHYYATIDGDRIFGSTGWDNMDIEGKKFCCFTHDFHKMLYDIVLDDEQFKIVRLYASKIRDITDSDIDVLLKTMDGIYNDPKGEHVKITNILKTRKTSIMSACNGSCFNNVKQKRLSANV
jgi:hypothetical protein